MDPAARRLIRGGSRGGADPRGIADSIVLGLTPDRVSGLVGWHRSDSVILASGEVDILLDLSPRGNNLSASGATNRLLYTPSDALFGGQPSMQGDGALRWLGRASYSFGGSIGAFTIIIVGYGLSIVSGGRFFAHAGGTWRVGHNATGHFQLVQTGTGAVSSTSNPTTALTAPRMWFARCTAPGAQDVGQNGSVEDSDTNTHLAFTDPAAVGVFASNVGTAPSTLSAADFILYNRHLQNNELAGLLSGYVRPRYKLAA